MKKSGLADSPFFFQPDKEQPVRIEEGSGKHDAMPPRHHATSADTTASRYRDTIEVVRKAVKEVGKEAATHRFTMREKQALAEIIYQYRKQGVKTSENEIARIALNHLMEDFHQLGTESVLARVLKLLNA